MASLRVRMHRIVSWSLVVSFFATIITGYGQTQNWFKNQYVVSKIHRIFEWFFIAFLIYHIVYTVWKVRIKTSKLVLKIREGRGSTVNSLRFIQKITSWFTLALIILLILAGLNGYIWFAKTFGTVIPFAWHRKLDMLMNISIFIHIAIGFKFLLIRKKIGKRIVDYSLVIITIFLIGGAIYLQIPKNSAPPPTSEGNVSILIGDETFKFSPENVTTIRPDIFVDGHFSMFDILVHLDEGEFIDLQYHFDSSMNTHVIDLLNLEANWWYQVFYSGGWPERNVYRMDHYPWKEDTNFKLYKENDEFFDNVYSIFQEEVTRKTNNGGDVIVPTVIIRGSTFNAEFTNVLVTPHNIRNDTFQLGIITAIDIIMSLGDQGNISYFLKWYDSIGNADVVRSYWVNGINDDIAHGTCGWVYESGAWLYQRFAGNHIHIPQDFRPLNYPVYYETFWICL
ncbi:MAG: hypothetical protein ACTSPF_03225 [Candidatus Heimdallarchaeaceae archaeon]